MRIFEFKIAKYICKLFNHKFDEFHMYEVVCSRCRICREYTQEDEENLARRVAARTDGSIS